MSRDVIIGLDVGGTSVGAAAVAHTGEIIGQTVEAASPSDGTAEQIVRQLGNIVNMVRYQDLDNNVQACGIGIPGPFNYETGVSDMEHKFAAIRGLNLGSLLQQRTELPVYFVNDAAAFGLGVAWHQLPKTDRIIALTIGTGLGSSFIEYGKSIEDDDRIPPKGEMWDLKHDDGILEDVVSGRGISARYESKRGLQLGAKEIETQARHGNSGAIATYLEIGTALGEGLQPTFERFRPDKIVIGGKIARALDLFGKAAERALTGTVHDEPLIIRAAEENLAILGAAKHALELRLISS